MSATTDPVRSALEGQQQAAKLITLIRGGCSLPDQLYVRWQELRALGDGDKLRAFCRQVQKAIEERRC